MLGCDAPARPGLRDSDAAHIEHDAHGCANDTGTSASDAFTKQATLQAELRHASKMMPHLDGKITERRASSIPADYILLTQSTDECN